MSPFPRFRLGPFQSDWCPYKKRRGHKERQQGCAYTEERPCEDTKKRWSSTSQGERYQKK